MRNDQCLNDKVMNTILSAFLLDRHRWLLVDSCVTNRPPRRFKPQQPSHEYAIIPIHLPGHWNIAFADLKQRKIAIYDPLHRPAYRNQSKIVLSSFVPCLLGEEKETTEWQYATSECSLKQRDPVNCGIYCLVVGLLTILGAPMPKSINPALWREVLAAILESASAGNGESGTEIAARIVDIDALEEGRKCANKPAASRETDSSLAYYPFGQTIVERSRAENEYLKSIVGQQQRIREIANECQWIAIALDTNASEFKKGHNHLKDAQNALRQAGLFFPAVMKDLAGLDKDIERSSLVYDAIQTTRQLMDSVSRVAKSVTLELSAVYKQRHTEWSRKLHDTEKELRDSKALLIDTAPPVT